MNRRQFLATSSLSALHLFVSGCRSASKDLQRVSVPVPIPQRMGFGPLSPHPSLPFALPAGFQISVVQRALDPMSDGHALPGQPDGMACFALPNGNWVLLRNHELSDEKSLTTWSAKGNPFSDGHPPEPRRSENHFGGVSRAVLDPAALHTALDAKADAIGSALLSSNLVLSGTDSNCSGGVVDGAWISCEESSKDGHGYAFITRPEADTLQPPQSIPNWGRFHREAVARDPESGVIYMTEDRPDGCFYRFVPQNADLPFGEGQLQVLSIGMPHTSPYTEADQKPRWPNGTQWAAEWIDLPDPFATSESCRAQASRLGATRFYRAEGISPDAEGIWFIASTGGLAGGGQVFLYRPDLNVLELVLEIEDRTLLSCPDNLAISPWGHLIFCEDNYAYAEGVTHQHVRGMSREGEVYDMLKCTDQAERDPGPEFTGPCFSPDGSVLFVNVQTPLELTLAIRGPWPV